VEEVILVDQQDNVLGFMEKMLAHERGVLHRAFSVFIFNSNNELLLHQRAHHKYHSGGLWTNTCCSHQRKEESTIEAANRRLMEEMGMACDLSEIFSFIYKAPLDNALTEHELDHVLIGKTDTLPNINTAEVAAYKYMNLSDLKSDISSNPEQYTFWFKVCMDQHLEAIEQIIKTPS